MYDVYIFSHPEYSFTIVWCQSQVCHDLKIVKIDLKKSFFGNALLPFYFMGSIKLEPYSVTSNK